MVVFTSHLHVRAALCAGALAVAAAVAGSARAATTPALTFTGCGSANGLFQVTVNGSGFAGYPGLDVEITTSEAGAIPNPNYVLPLGAPNIGFGAAATLAADGSFSFPFSTGSGQQLPAAVKVYSFDAGTGAQGALLYGTTISASTVCADASIAGAKWSVPTRPSDCGVGAWRGWGLFRNQGDCISFLSTGGSNPP